jgi:hypothetical protein
MPLFGSEMPCDDAAAASRALSATTYLSRLAESDANPGAGAVIAIVLLDGDQPSSATRDAEPQAAVARATKAASRTKWATR